MGDDAASAGEDDITGSSSPVQGTDRPSSSPVDEALDDGDGSPHSSKAGKPQSEPSWPRDMLQLIYKKLDQKGGLMWMNREGDTPLSRVRDEREIELRRKHLEKLQKNYGRVSEGYGEMTMGSVSKMFEYLQGLGEWARIGKDSSFIDIGSGFGKVVFHAKLQCGVKIAHGIEYVSVRVSAADELKAEFFPDIGRSRELDFELADATTRANFDHYTHIYMYDRIFYEDTYVKLCPKLEASSFRILISYREPSFLHKHGLIHIDLIHKISMRSTGKQNFTAYIYRKRLASRKAIAAAKAAWLAKHRPEPPPRPISAARRPPVPPTATRIRAADILQRARARPVVHVTHPHAGGSAAPRRPFSGVSVAAASESRRRAQLAAAAAARRAQVAAARARAAAAAAATKKKMRREKPSEPQPRRKPRRISASFLGEVDEEWARQPRHKAGSRLERLALDAGAGAPPTWVDVASLPGRSAADFLLWELYSSPSVLAAALGDKRAPSAPPTGASWADAILLCGDESGDDEEGGAGAPAGPRRPPRPHPAPPREPGFGPRPAAPPPVFGAGLAPRRPPRPEAVRGQRGAGRGPGAGGWESGESGDEALPEGLLAFHDWGEDDGEGAGPRHADAGLGSQALRSRLPACLQRALWSGRDREPAAAAAAAASGVPP
eukprot:tig00020614_g12208.t1